MKAARWTISALSAASLVLAFLVGLSFLIWKLCVVAGATAAPSFSQQWHEQVYGLDEGEFLRFIPPPYSPARMKDFAGHWAGAPPKNQTGQLVYHELPTRIHQWGMSSATGDVKTAMEYTSRLAVA